MNKHGFLFWLFFFWCGAGVLFSVPETSFPVMAKFFCLGGWGSLVALLTFKLVSNAFQHKLQEETEALEESFREKLTQKNPEEMASEKNSTPSNEVPELPIETLEDFIKSTLKNRPFHEPVQALSALLPEMFPESSGVLYMYNGKQSEMTVIFSYGATPLGKAIISPSECASFNRGEIIVTDFENPGFSDGCTHLDPHEKGVAFCIPIEGLEEHFGILSVYAPMLSEEARDLWKIRLRTVSAVFGLFVATQNLNIRFEEHSIRDTLTGLYNRKHMEESLQRAISAAKRHASNIGVMLLSLDAVPLIRDKYGKQVVDQLLWEIGQRLPKYIRLEDIPARYENEVFCIILPSADISATRDRAERIRKEIEALEISYGSTLLKTTLSIGVVAFPAFTRSERPDKELIQVGIRAMQRAADFKNRVVTAAELEC